MKDYVRKPDGQMVALLRDAHATREVLRERDEHLLRSLPPARHVVLYDRDATREAVLVSQALENALRSMLLLLGLRLVVGQDLGDDW